MPFTLVFPIIFGGVPELVGARAVTSRKVHVYFSENMLVADALDPANWSIDHGIEVDRVEQIVDSEYIVFTVDRLLPNVTYVITASNIRTSDGAVEV